MPRSTRFWVGNSSSEVIPQYSGGNLSGGSAEHGGLSVTGPTGRGGARPESRLNTVASERKRPPTSEVRHEVHRIAGGEVLSTEGRSRPSSGSRVIRRGAILLLFLMMIVTIFVCRILQSVHCLSHAYIHICLVILYTMVLYIICQSLTVFLDVSSLLYIAMLSLVADRPLFVLHSTRTMYVFFALFHLSQFHSVAA